jgi:uncharacterized protein (DUF2267 family)
MAFSWEGLDMKFEEFIGSVAERAGVSTEEAEPLARAARCGHWPKGSPAVKPVTSPQLPIPLQNPLLAVTEEEAEPFGLDEFIRRTAERSGLDRDKAEIGVYAVMSTLREAVTPGEFDDVISQLPQEFKELGVK